MFYTEDDEVHDIQTLSAGFTVASRYQIQSVVGVGGMGIVYLARDQVLGGEPVALKVLHREYARKHKYMQRFLREVQLMHRVNHPNVVRTFDVGADGELIYFTMEYVPGCSLQDSLDKGSFSSQQVVALLAQICEGLEAIHEEAIVHRDLKPGNIIVIENNSIKIADFGLARPEISSLTSHNEVIGSAAYMAPEIWLGKDVTPAIDIYSLGILAYELCTGVLPFDSDTPATMMRLHLDKEPVPPMELNPNTPAWLNRLILRLLAKNPADRPNRPRDVGDYIGRHAGFSTAYVSESIDADTATLPTVDTSFIEQLEERSHATAAAATAEDLSTVSRLRPKIVDNDVFAEIARSNIDGSTLTNHSGRDRSASLFAAAYCVALLLMHWVFSGNKSELGFGALILGSFAACFLTFVFSVAAKGVRSSNAPVVLACFAISVVFSALSCCTALLSGGGFELSSLPSLTSAALLQTANAFFLSPLNSSFESSVLSSGLLVFPQAVSAISDNWTALVLSGGFAGFLSWTLYSTENSGPRLLLMQTLVLSATLLAIICLEGFVLNSLWSAQMETLDASVPSFLSLPVLFFSALNWFLVLSFTLYRKVR